MARGIPDEKGGAKERLGFTEPAESLAPDVPLSLFDNGPLNGSIAKTKMKNYAYSFYYPENPPPSLSDPSEFQHPRTDFMLILATGARLRVSKR